jgi:protein arginine N-methyltransferase 1
VHGILMWFETDLAPGIGFSNAPGMLEQIYGQAFFPLEQPVTLADEAAAEAEISAALVNGDYIWNWSFRANDSNGEAHAFRQSTFKGMLLPKESLAPYAQDFRPPARKAQEVDIACLSMFNGKMTLAEIASKLRARFPDHFCDGAAAFEHVTGISARYNRGNVS